MPDREQGATEWRLAELEKDMKAVNDAAFGEAPTSLKSRIGVLEDDKKARVVVQATIAGCVSCVFAAVVWFAQSGVIERVDALRQELRAQRATAPASGRAP